MLWVLLLLILSFLADRRAEVERQTDLNNKNSKVLNLLSFLALAVPGLLILDAAAIIHLYLSWYHAGAVLLNPSPVITGCMAAGCVLWIYGRVLPDIPFGSAWGFRTSKTTASKENWTHVHRKTGIIFCILGVLALCTGTLLLL